MKNNTFLSSINPDHPIGGGTAIKISGDYRTVVYSSFNVYNDTWSFGTGVFTMFSGYIEESNSIFAHNFAVGGCLFCLFQTAIVVAKDLLIYNSSGSLGNVFNFY